MAFDFIQKTGIAVASLAITVYVIAQIADALPADSVANNMVDDMVDAFTNVGTWLPIIVIVALASLVFILIRGVQGGKQ